METLAKQKEMVVARANEKQEYVTKNTVWADPYVRCGRWDQETVYKVGLKCNEEVVSQHQDTFDKWLVDLPDGWVNKINVESSRDNLVTHNTIKDITQHYRVNIKEGYYNQDDVAELQNSINTEMAALMAMPFKVKLNTDNDRNGNAFKVAMLVSVYGESITRVYDGVFSTKVYKLSTHERTTLDYHIDTGSKCDNNEFEAAIGWVFRRNGVIKAYEMLSNMLEDIYDEVVKYGQTT